MHSKTLSIAVLALIAASNVAAAPVALNQALAGRDAPIPSGTSTAATAVPAAGVLLNTANNSPAPPAPVPVPPVDSSSNGSSSSATVAPTTTTTAPPADGNPQANVTISSTESSSVSASSSTSVSASVSAPILPDDQKAVNGTQITDSPAPPSAAEPHHPSPSPSSTSTPGNPDQAHVDWLAKQLQKFFGWGLY
ncbi:hypothetical protein H0H93_000634 [Arthromyces matolae]|nr:hypothetical protein H0H93_000634 [Arthromyces matolae]